MLYYNSFELSKKWAPIVSAYNDGMTVHELIKCLRKMTEELYGNECQLNEKMDNLIQFIEKGGFERYIIKELRKMRENGELAKIINEEIFQELNSRIRTVENNFEIFKDETEQQLKKASILEKEKRINVRYFMDGSYDGVLRNFTDALQSALNSKFTIIETPEGVYDLVKTIRIPSGKTLSMYGTTIRKSSSFNTMFLGDSAGVIGGYDAIDSIVVEGGMIDVNGERYSEQAGAFAFGHANNILIKEVNMKNLYDWHYIEFNACKSCRVIDCKFEGQINPSGTEMIQLDLALSANEFPWYGPFDSTPCDDILIQGCVFQSGRIGIGSHTSALNKQHRHVRIVSNEFRNMSKFAVSLLNTNDVVFSNNQLEDCYNGFATKSHVGNTCKNYTIVGNTISKCVGTDSRGIHIQGDVNEGTITGNLLSNIGRHGIGVDDSTRWTVSGNTLYNIGRVGIWIYGTTRTVVKGNNVTEANTVGQSDTYGIQIGFVGADAQTGTNNILVADNYTEGLGVRFTTTTFVTNNMVTRRGLVLTNNANQVAKANVVEGAYQE